MSRKIYSILAILILMVVAVACGGGQTPASDEVPVVDAVITTPTTDPALATDAGATTGDAATTTTGGGTGVAGGASGGAGAQNGTISGGLIFPSEGIPPMRIVAVTTNGGAFYDAETGPGDNSYSISVPPGDYYVYAYPQGTDSGAAHSTATWCYAEPTAPDADTFFQSDCEHHDEVAVTVAAGVQRVGVDIYDWYAGPDAFPPPPDAPNQTAGGATGGPTGGNTGGPTGGNTSGPPTTVGVIGGRISYPSEGVPPMRIFALRTDGQAWQFVLTTQNQTSYSMQLSPGTYHILAEVQIDGLIGTFSGGYTQYSVCLLQDPQCPTSDHTLVPVTVNAGDALDNIDVTDWFFGSVSVPAVPGD